MPKILLIDDEKSIRRSLREILEFEKFQVEEAEDGLVGLAKITSEQFDVVLCDVKMPKLDGLELLQKLTSIGSEVPLVMMSGHGNIETAVEAVKKGAYDFLTKPVDLNRLLVTLRNALDKHHLVSETKALRKKVVKGSEIIGNSKAIEEVKALIEKVAPTDARVLITGANGSGKELVARQLHDKSNRAKFAFIEVNCAAIPSELIESELF
ncbi:MAG TPA: response regulator, partial [Bacteroidia bacterium]